MYDPRGSREYKIARKQWLKNAADICCLCGARIDMQLPHRFAGALTVEHRTPIRTIMAMARTQAEAIRMACDVSMWGSAHSRCQSQQGARVVNKKRKEIQQRRQEVGLNPSRRW